jgi:DNA-binding response OmpR family regulator
MKQGKQTDVYTSKDGLVRIEKTTQARRWPPHGYPVVILTFKPQRGTRVLAREDGSTEWMPKFSEVSALILQLGLKLQEVPPDKPEQRRIYWKKRNDQRHGDQQ